MPRSFAVVAIALALVASGAFIARVPAQQPAPVQTELLAEVRLLRQAIESLAGTNARVQIVFGRLTLQEQRTTNAAKRLDDARKALTALTRDIDNLSDHANDSEAVENDSRRTPDEREQFRKQGTMLRRQIAQMESQRARLAGDEAEAATALNQEQGRWSDLNRQLEELERALVRPK